MINHRKGETKNLEKLLKGNRDKMDLLQQEYSAYNRALKETESTLSNTSQLSYIEIISFLKNIIFLLSRLHQFRKESKIKSD